jgi:hypothetical protein
MHPRFHSLNRVLAGGLAAALFAATVSAQQSVRGKPSEANLFIETPAGWVQPKTPWGDPDLQGVWPIPGGTNLERCAGGGRGRPGGPPAPPCDPDKAFLTEAEYEERLAAVAKQIDRHAEAIKAGDFGQALQSGVTDPTTPLRQTSLILDPPNGRLPELTPEGKRRSALMRSSWALPDERVVWDHWEDFDTWDRCITRGMPSSMFAYRYNNGIEIMQAPGYVVINMEMVHEARIIPVDGRPPLSPAHSQYMGESRGRWEGDTLVITTTNYKPGPSGTNIGVFGSPPGNRFPVSDQMKTTERLTRLDDDYILYEITTEDPIVMTRPYTVRQPLKLDNSYQWWEYACHEGNRTIRDFITSSRAERAAEAANPQPAPPAGAPQPPQGR